MEVVGFVEHEHDPPFPALVLHEEKGQLRAHPRVGCQDSPPLQETLARVILLAQCVGIGMCSEVMYAVMARAVHV